MSKSVTACMNQRIAPDPKNPGRFACLGCGYQIQEGWEKMYSKDEAAKMRKEWEANGKRR